MLARHSETLFLICLLIGVFVFWQAAGNMQPSPRYAQVDADLWPRIVLVCLAITTSLMVIQNLAAAVESEAATDRAVGEGAAYYTRLSLIAGLILLYYFGLKYVGFGLATVVFLWAASNILRFPKVWIKVAFAPAFTLALGFFFSRALSLPLPRGQGVFYAISTALF